MNRPLKNKDEISSDSEDNVSHDSKSSNDKKKPNSVVPKGFEDSVREWVRLDNKVRQLSDELKELRKEKKPKEDSIIKHLEQNGINVIEINGGKLRRNKSETKQKIQQEDIEKALKNKLNTQKASEIMEYMENNRSTKINVNLKRTNERPIKKKAKNKSDSK